MTPQLVVFLKAPRPGLVKTRLGVSLGNDQACEAYRAMALFFLRKLAAFPRVQLCFAPDNALSEIKPFQLNSKWTLKPQGEGDLGARLGRATTACLARGDGVLCLGADCPYVEEGDLVEACEALERHDVVIGPALDGGYWLIGLRRACHGLFDAIPWSSERGLDVTRSRIIQAGLSCHELRTLEDVDTLDDWHRCEALLRSASRGI